MSMQPPKTLTRKQLTVALILVTLVPFSMVVLLFFMSDRGADPVLPAEVSVGPRSWPRQPAEDSRLMPCVTIRNPTDEDWTNLNMSLNEQYFFYHTQPLAAGEEFYVPLGYFQTKGTKFFPPDSQPLLSLMVFAQLPSGARAILEVEDPAELEYDSSQANTAEEFQNDSE